MVANTCNGACAHEAAILAVIKPRRATKGVLGSMMTYQQRGLRQ